MIAKKRSSSMLTLRKFFESLLTFENFLVFTGTKNLDKNKNSLFFIRYFRESRMIQLRRGKNKWLHGMKI